MTDAVEVGRQDGCRRPSAGIRGEVLRLAERVGSYAPCNASIADLVEAWPDHPQPMHGPALHCALGL